MTFKGLKLNADKTQLTWQGTRQQLAKLTEAVIYCDSVDTWVYKWLHGVSLLCITTRCPTILKDVWRSSISQSFIHYTIHCRFVGRLDYINAVLAGTAVPQVLNGCNLYTIQHPVSGRDHVTQILRFLHWLSVGTSTLLWWTGWVRKKWRERKKSPHCLALITKS